MRIGYTRVSSTDQNTDRQELPDVEKMFTDKASGGSTDRPALTELLEFAREGDVVVVWSIDRFARSLIDLQTLVSELNGKGVAVEFVSERLTFNSETDDPFAALQMQLMGAFAEFERKIIRKRQKEGIAKAKARGAFKGRKPSIDRDEIARRHAEGQKPTHIARDMGISRPSVYRIVAELS
ncbi:recombinase family protein [Roseovarius sp. E0-M6]|uniref:recombinase family protein n=1 Tax=Roseovarius sp. E0-M6 TaxID=3127118 RepID=UPI003FA6DCEE